MDKEKIYNKIRKLLSLANSSNQHEAELAMQKANELMQEHQILMSEVILEQTTAENVISGNKIRVSETYRSFVRDIGAAAGLIFDAHVVRIMGEQTDFFYVGMKEDILMAENLFNYLFKSWKSIVSADTREWRAYRDPSQYEVKQYKISHGQGFSQALLIRAQKLAKERKDAVSKSATTGTQLVVLKDQLVKAYLDEKTRPIKESYKQQHGGYSQGRKRGEEIPLGGAVEKTSNRITDKNIR